jgi:RNA polymerase sigma factor for flagellar operon FliA
MMETMKSMQDVSSALIARNDSWVRQQAGAMMRRVPSNVEKADLIQVGLIAVAQAAQGFKWPGDPDSEDSREAFVRYARLRVKGAMIDELRQMDHLHRSERRKINAIQIARERWRALHGANPALAALSDICGLDIDEVARLDQAALSAMTESLSHDDDAGDHVLRPEPATSADEVEARVDTAIVLRRLEKFFAELPLRERQAIDACLGIGMSPIELADVLKVTPARVSQLYKAAREQIARHMEHPDQRRIDHLDPPDAEPLEDIVAQHDRQPWGALMEQTLTAPDSRFGVTDAQGRLVVDNDTRWG